jgi:hypothetical protein
MSKSLIDLKKAYCKAYIIDEKHFAQDLFARSLKCNRILSYTIRWILLFLNLQTVTLIQFTYLGSSKNKFQLDLQLKEIKINARKNMHWLMRLFKVYPSQKNLKRIVYHLEMKHYLPWANEV